MFTQIAHGVITLYRLSVFEAVHWDRGLAKETAELSATLGTLIEKMRQVKHAAGLDVGVAEDSDVYSTTASRLQTIRDCKSTLSQCKGREDGVVSLTTSPRMTVIISLTIRPTKADIFLQGGMRRSQQKWRL